MYLGRWDRQVNEATSLRQSGDNHGQRKRCLQVAVREIPKLHLVLLLSADKKQQRERKTAEDVVRSFSTSTSRWDWGVL